MTTETEFGRYTQAEVDEIVEREIKREVELEREQLAKLTLVLVTLAYAVGVACGGLVL
jgi:hypothetical protein